MPAETERVLSPVETVTFTSRKAKVSLEAKVDTGAKRTSIDEGLARALGCRPLNKTVKVRCASRDDPQTRRLVRLPLEVGGEEFRVEASLADRTHLSYPVILGRDVLAQGDFQVAVPAE